MNLEVEFVAPLIRWEGKASWHFIVLPEDVSEDIEEWCGDNRGGWGSVKVVASIGAVTWSTSIFPSKARGTFLLPVKADVRKRTNIAEGDDVPVQLRI